MFFSLSIQEGEMKNWNMDIAGVTFKNPIIVTAGTPTRKVHGLESSIRAGAGGVCTKSISFQPFSWPFPRPCNSFLDKWGDPGSIIGFELGFWQPEEGENFIKKIRPLAEKENTRVIANIAVEEFETEKLKDLAKRLQDSGADMIEIGCPCPILIPIEVSEAWYEKNLSRVIEILKEAVDVPVYPKLFVDALSEKNMRRIEDAGADAVHLVPPPHGITVDVESGKPFIPIYGLYYNRGWRGIGSYWTYIVSEMAKIPVISSGGVFGGRDAVERVMLGASLVGICTAVIYYGYQRISKIIKEFDEFMERKGFRTIEDILGVASPYVGDLQAFGRLVQQRQVPRETVTIEIDYAKCTKCGRCLVCNYGAMTMENKTPRIDLTLCERCGVCESLCPVDAIMIQRPV
jgi:dihydroorotate dehydrogenase/Pyruvate/2-oxoacid:ferredoxin oxidoreductase delta subunit